MTPVSSEKGRSRAGRQRGRPSSRVQCSRGGEEASVSRSQGTPPASPRGALLVDYTHPNTTVTPAPNSMSVAFPEGFTRPGTCTILRKDCHQTLQLLFQDPPRSWGRRAAAGAPRDSWPSWGDPCAKLAPRSPEAHPPKDPETQVLAWPISQRSKQRHRCEVPH